MARKAQKQVTHPPEYATYASILRRKSNTQPRGKERVARRNELWENYTSVITVETPMRLPLNGKALNIAVMNVITNVITFMLILG